MKHRTSCFIVSRRDRDAALADNPNLNYTDAVEVRLLLETLPPPAEPAPTAPLSEKL